MSAHPADFELDSLDATSFFAPSGLFDATAAACDAQKAFIFSFTFSSLGSLTPVLLTIDERLDVLLHVKWTVKEFDCNLTRDIVELIDREADMLNRGRGEASLSGLRKRLANLYLQFIETPEFNPEAARFQKVPSELMVRPNVKPLEGASALGGSAIRA